jgi:hypothetical protein
LLVAMSAAMIDRRLAGERAKMLARGRSHTKPVSFVEVPDSDPSAETASRSTSS